MTVSSQLSAAHSTRREGAGPLAAEEFCLLDAYCRAAKFLPVGQIQLLANPLLREPPRWEHVKPRLLGLSGQAPAHAAR